MNSQNPLNPYVLLSQKSIHENLSHGDWGRIKLNIILTTDTKLVLNTWISFFSWLHSNKLLAQSKRLTQIFFATIFSNPINSITFSAMNYFFYTFMTCLLDFNKNRWIKSNCNLSSYSYAFFHIFWKKYDLGGNCYL